MGGAAAGEAAGPRDGGPRVRATGDRGSARRGTAGPRDGGTRVRATGERGSARRGKAGQREMTPVGAGGGRDAPTGVDRQGRSRS